MLKGLYDIIYGIAFTNHRYEKDKYNVHFFASQSECDKALEQMKNEGEIFTFEFALGYIGRTKRVK